MYIREFVIPLHRDDLLKCSNGEFYVNEQCSVKEISERLEASRISLSEEGIYFIVDHFSTFYSILQNFKQCSQLIREKGWKTIRKAFVLLTKNGQVLLEDSSNMDSDIQFNMRNVTKMTVYALVEFLKMFQDLHVVQNDISLKGKQPKKKQNNVISEVWDWNEEKHAVLVEIHTFLQLPLKFLWEPPVVDEDFVNLFANFCYSCLEDPNIAHASTKQLRETLFQVLGILIRNYLHGLSFCVKVVQLLKVNDHLVNPLAQGIIYLVQECKCNNVVKEIVREVAETDGDQLAADTAGTRSINLFLVQLAESIPETIVPAMDLLISHLSGDSYSMRVCVVGVLGEIVLMVLTKENLGENMKKMRDECLDCLEEHIHDVNAFVRTKVLQIWQKLCVGKAIPILRLNQLLELVTGRLNDKSTNVKKQAVHLIKDMLEWNPFCGELNISEIQLHLSQEKKKLESYEKDFNLKDSDVEWTEMEAKLRRSIETFGSEIISEFNHEEASTEEMIHMVGNLLINGDYEKAVESIMKLKNQFYQVYSVNEKESVSQDTLIEILKKIFNETKRAAMLNIPLDVREKIEKHNMTIQYLENALEFSEKINRALPIILRLLDSNIVSDALEAIHFFSAAYLFGFEQALEGVRKMLHLIFSKDAVIKSAVSDVYKKLYFQTYGSPRQQAIATINNLCELILKLNFSQLNALEEVVKEWVKAEMIDQNCVQVMFEKFSRKLPGNGNDQCWAALVLIGMVGGEEPKIIKSNLTLLLNEGLKKRGFKNFLIAKEICKALHHLLPRKEQGKAFDQTLRYAKDHEMFKVLHSLLSHGLWNTNDPYYVPMAEEAVNLVFTVCDKPDDFFKDLIVDIHSDILKDERPREKENSVDGNALNNMRTYDEFLEDSSAVNPNSQAENASAAEEPRNAEDRNEIRIALLTRFISVLGQVASNYILYLEGPVLEELKLRNQLEYERKLRKHEENRRFNVTLRKNKKGMNESGGDKNLNESGVEDLEFNRVAADDMDAEEMKKKTEKQIVTGQGFLAKFSPLILAVCKNPDKYNNNPLQNAALLTLAKFMQVSSIFCEENLQLLVTICEKSLNSERQENAIIALGILQYRFPNSLEPWTPHMYAMLQNSNPSVRYSSILILTDLIVNEMIKVRSHIANLAFCIVDEEIKIAKVARHFFREYAQKGNSLFNLLPTLISSLTQGDSPLSPEKFKVITKFVLGLVTKEKQSEYLMEKLCQYFESATSERQWSDLSYCLSLLTYSDKALRKIIENFRCFAGKLYLAEVYEAFCSIISDTMKNPQRDKTLVNELQTMIKEYRERTCQNKSVCVLPEKRCPPSAKKRLRRQKYLPSESEDEENVRTMKIPHRKRKHVSRAKDSNTDDDVCDDCDDEGDDDGDDDEIFLSADHSKKKTSARRNNRKEENNSESSDSGESCRKNSKSKLIFSRKAKRTIRQAKNSSNDDEEREEVRKRPLRSCKK